VYIPWVLPTKPTGSANPYPNGGFAPPTPGDGHGLERPHRTTPRLIPHHPSLTGLDRLRLHAHTPIVINFCSGNSRPSFSQMNTEF
jgi:hypothetical protein